MTRKEQADLTKQRILSTVLHTLSANNLSSIKVSDICTAAGVSVGTFYHYFKSKEDVLLSAGEVYDMWMENRIEGREYASVRKKIEQIISNFYANAVFCGLNGLATQYSLQLVAGKSDFGKDGRYFVKEIKKCVRKGIESGEFSTSHDIDDIHHMVVHFMRGITCDWLLSKGDFDLVIEGCRQTNLMLNRLLDGKN
jgi:AcrR family transcriptional regulator